MSQKNAMPKVVSEAEWKTSRYSLLEKEKALTRQIDAINAERRRLPMMAIDKEYQFQSNQGSISLLDLFEGRSQLIVYHFMFAPDWDEGCPGCSWVTDAMSHPAHLKARDTSFVLVSLAPLDKLHAYQQRMGWNTVNWVSSQGSDFNYDLGGSDENGEHHGVSVFLSDGENIYRSYYTCDRGVEHLGSHWTYLDLTPYGRQESWEDSPEGWPQTPPYGWICRHDDYPESD